MPKLFPKIILLFFSWILFIVVIFKVDYPQSLAQATPFQLLTFFTSLFLGLTSTIYLALMRLLPSLVFSTGIILLLLLKALGVLNIATGIIAIIAVFLVAGSFRKTKSSSLTYRSKIPKLKNLLRRKR